MSNTWEQYGGPARPLMVDHRGICEPIKGGLMTVAVSTDQANNASVGSNSSVAIGGLASTGTGCPGAIAIGTLASVATDAQNAVAVGRSASCALSRGIGIGAYAASSGAESTSIGGFSSASGTRSISIGDQVVTTAADTITLGTQPVCLRLGTSTSAASLTSVATPSNANAALASPTIPVGGIYRGPGDPAILYIRTA